MECENAEHWNDRWRKAYIHELALGIRACPTRESLFSIGPAGIYLQGQDRYDIDDEIMHVQARGGVLD